MDRSFLEISQMLENHPILEENDSCKARYINILEYFARKYSPDDLWTQALVRLYAKKMLQGSYLYEDLDLKRQVKEVTATKFWHFKFST